MANKEEKGSRSTISEPITHPEPTPLDGTLRLLTRFERFGWDIAGVLALALGLITLLALWLPELAGGVLIQWWAGQLRFWFGWGSAWVAVAAGAAGIHLLRVQRAGDAANIRWSRVIAFEAAAFGSLILMTMLNGDSLARAEAGLDGGIIGWGMAEFVRIMLELVGLTAPLWRTFVAGAVTLIAAAAGLGVLDALSAWAHGKTRPVFSPEEAFVELGPAISEAPMQGQEDAPRAAKDSRKKPPALPIEFRKNFRIQAQEEEKSVDLPPRDERLPPLELLLNEQAARHDERNINLTAGLIEKTLAEFGIPAKVVGFRIGPTVTQFAVEPGFLEKDKPNGEGDLNRQKIRVAQISALNRDLALALSASRLRIEAPVPGRPYVGIEVPNTRSAVVRLRALLESDAFYRLNSPLAIVLGRDVSGQPVVADLSRMPHLLIAGTTGSGKSVCIEAITTCLVTNNTPEDLRLVMVDPKMVELVRFNGLPHLFGKVETELERILAVLRWTVAEMDRRYKLLESSRSRNIDTYNKKLRRRKGEEPLPRIVVMIDELADLMMSAPDQTEHNLVRLAQMARAVGIHLVVATQRPSTDVVTGLIKANFPARISFAVASSIDSRVILDTPGAEALLGRGDMLFLPPEASAPVRAQGALVTDQEIEKIITFWSKTSPTASREVQAAPWEEMMEQEAMLADRDDLVQRAVDVIRESQRASASMLQRRLHIGYPRAARLIDELEGLGYVGPSQGGGRERDVLIGPEADRENPS